MSNKYQVCTRCVMDTTDPDIHFDQQGVCNHCHYYDANYRKYIFTPEQAESNLNKWAATIKSEAKGKYDSIIGMSGGVDSSYICYLAKKMGLNPLCVHFDNGWNSKTAVSNIKKIVDSCGFDLETYVISWPEFKDLQRSYIKAGVIDIEMLTDHAIMATMFKLRKEFKLKYILSGTNFKTEHGMPESWIWRKQDLKNIKSIHRLFGTRKLKEFPTMGSLKFLMSLKLGWGGTYVELLNNINYNKEAAMETLKKEFGWEYYGGKHYESVFTKFYQAYILPTKFNVDKRKVHFSALIHNHEISREEALIELSQPIYEPIALINEKDFVLKKLGFTENEFDQLMKEAPKAHTYYGSDEKMIKFLKRIRG